MNLVVSVRAESVLALLRGYPNRLTDAMVRVVNRFTLELQARTKEKLSGEVLHVRTGTLRRSINRKVELRGSNVVGTVGTNVEYAAAHEYGFDGEVTVRAHVRRVASRTLTELRGTRRRMSVQGVAFVKEHTMHMHVPERSFLRSALAELEPGFAPAVRKAAAEALKV